MNIMNLSMWQFTAMRYCIYSLLVLVPLWYGAGHLFPYTTAKSLIVILGAVIMVGFWLWGMAKAYDNTIRMHWMHIVMAVLILSMTISAVAGVDTQLSFFGSLIDGTGLNLVFASMIVGIGVSFWVKYKPDFLEKLAWVSIWTAVIVALGTYFQTAFPTSSGGSTFGNTSYMAAYFLINICFAIGLLMTQSDRWKKILAGIPLVLMLFAPTFFNRWLFTGDTLWGEAFRNPLLFAGVSNGASVALVIMMGVIVGLFMYVRSGKQVLKYIGVGIASLSVVGMVGFWVLFQTPGNAVHEFFVERKTTNRLLFWEIAREGIADRPMFGWGMNNYAYVFQEKFKPEFFSKNNIPELWTNNPHNMVWEYGVNQGIIGLGLYLILIIGAIGIMFRRMFQDVKKAPWMIVGIGGLIGYFIQNLFIFDTPGTMIFFWSVIGIAIGSADWKLYSFPARYQHIARAKFIIIAIMLILLLPMIVFKPWKESKEWVKYSQFEQMMNREVNPQYISRLGYASDSAYIAGRALELIRNEFARSMSDEQAIALLQMVDRLRTVMEQELQSSKPNVRAHWTLGQMNGLLANFVPDNTVQSTFIDQAEFHLTQASQLSPGNMFILLDRVQIDVLKKDIASAEQRILYVLANAPEHYAGYMMAQNIDSVTSKSFKEQVRLLAEKNGMNVP
jgi:hypothetical protein